MKLTANLYKEPISQESLGNVFASIQGLPIVGVYNVLLNQTFMIGEYAEHEPRPFLAPILLELDCPWRITFDGVIAVCSSDPVPCGNSEADSANAALEEGEAWRASLLQGVIGEVDQRGFVNPESRRTIECVTTNQAGDLAVTLSGGFMLEAFASSRLARAWTLYTSQANYSGGGPARGALFFKHIQRN